MSIEQRANIKFCFKLGKTFSETHQMMKEVYGDDCLSRSRIHEWFKRFQEGREALEDVERSGRPRNVVNEENAEIVREFIRKEPKSSLIYTKSELEISALSIYRILTENLGYIKVCAKFVPHTLKSHEKDLRIQHSRNIIRGKEESKLLVFHRNL